MTHPSPEAVEANTNWAMMIASHLTHIPAGDRSQRERALVFLSEAVTALTAPPEVSEEMVERGARAMRDEALLYRVSQIQGFVNHPRDDRHWIRDLTLPPSDQVIWDGGPSSDEMMEALEHIKAKHIARAALTAALGVKNG